MSSTIGALHTALGLRGVGTNDVDVQRMQRPAELGHAIAADRISVHTADHARRQAIILRPIPTILSG